MVRDLQNDVGLRRRSAYGVRFFDSVPVGHRVSTTRLHTVL